MTILILMPLWGKALIYGGAVTGFIAGLLWLLCMVSRLNTKLLEEQKLKIEQFFLRLDPEAEKLTLEEIKSFAHEAATFYPEAFEGVRAPEYLELANTIVAILRRKQDAFITVTSSDDTSWSSAAANMAQHEMSLKTVVAIQQEIEDLLMLQVSQ